MGKLTFFLRVNIRNLFTNKKFAWVNIIGLSIGVTVSLLILLYVRYETSFDDFNPSAGHIYRVVTENLQDGSVKAYTPLALSDVLKKDYPELDKVVSLMNTYFDIKVGRETFENLKGAVVEKDFFSLFNFPLTEGDPATVFQDPFDAVVSKRLAIKLYGTSDVLGKTFGFENFTFRITGIINNIPSNSVFDLDYLLSDSFRYKYFPDIHERWYHFGLFTFVTFKGSVKPGDFEKKLTGIESQYYPDFMKGRNRFLVMPFKGSHLNPMIENDMVPNVKPVYLWILSAIALGILIIACLNFMNISIANASKRNVDTAIRKVSGASPMNLIGDFFAEITFLVIISLLLSFIGVYLLLPPFNSLIQKDISVDLSDPVLWYGIAGFGILTIITSGLYPSILLSKPSPVRVLLHNKDISKNKFTFQKSFVILQFTLTIILAIAQLFIIKQIVFMKNHETGFNKESLITIPVGTLGDYNEKMKNTTLLVQDLEKYQSQYGFGKISVTEFVPGFGFRNLFKIYPDDGSFNDGIELLSCDVDENFPDVFGLKVIRGRFFSKDYPTDIDALVINETAWKILGWKSLDNKSVGLIEKNNKKHVIGVVNDINVRSLQYPVKPMIYQFGRHHNYPGYITMRIDPGRSKETIDFIRTQWISLFPDIPFSFESVSQKYLNFYGEEIKMAKITGAFAMLAMLLSLLGIFALSRLAAEKRIKEIGIRKINGARTKQVVIMFNRDFLTIVFTACIIGYSVGWYVMSRWLLNFAYRTGLSWWVFAISGIIVISLALLTVSWQSWRAASRNPVEALRYE